MKSLNPWLLISFLVAFALACGLTDPKYIDYAEETGAATPAPTATATPCTTTALASFTTNVDSIVSPSCSGCHSSKPFKLQSNAAAANRAMIKSWSKWGATKTAGTLVSYITGTSHQGASVAAPLTETKVKTWLDTEICGD